MRRTFIVFLVTLVLDQITKVWVVQALDLKSRLSIEVLPPFLNLRMAWNRGVNFGLFSGEDAKWILIAIAAAVSIGVLFWGRRESDWKVHVSTGMLVGGALGNIIDRIAYGAVADFLNMSCCGLNNPFAFNVADIAIFAGAIGLVFFAGNKKTAA